MKMLPSGPIISPFVVGPLIPSAAVATVVVSRWEGALDRDQLNAALNGNLPEAAEEALVPDGPAAR